MTGGDDDVIGHGIIVLLTSYQTFRHARDPVLHDKTPLRVFNCLENLDISGNSALLSTIDSAASDWQCRCNSDIFLPAGSSTPY